MVFKRYLSKPNFKALLFTALLFGSLGVGAQTTIQIGTGSVPLTSTGESPFGSFYHDGKNQFLILGSELNNAGITQGQLVDLAFDVITTPSPTYTNFTVTIGTTGSSTIAPFIPLSGSQVCFTGALNPSPGWNTITFQNPYLWSGNDNLVVEVCFDNNSYGSTGQVLGTATSFVSNAYEYADFAVGCTMTGTGFNAGSSINRPNMQMNWNTNICSAPPTAGTATGPATICPGTNFSVSINGSSSGIGQTYQWQESSNNVSWNDITGATNPSFSGSQTQTTYYRCVVTCSGQSDTTSSHFVDLTPANICNLCTSGASFGGDTYLNGLNLGSINYADATCANYTNNTNLSTVVFQGSSYSGTINHGDCDGGSSYGRGVLAFADWNRDGDFSDPGEQLLSVDLPGTSLAGEPLNFTVPQNAVPGPTVLRIIASEDGTSGTASCGNFSYGETEDYTLIISTPPANDAGVAALAQPSIPACSLNDTIIIDIQNLGTTPLTSADVSLQVNGGTPITSTFSGNIASGSTGTHQAAITPLSDGDVIKVWTSNPNGVADSLAMNDTLELTMYTSLSGAYTVSGQTPDYPDLDSALTDLALRGACGNVTFNLRAGSYNSNHVLNDFQKNAPTDRVIIQSEDLEADSVEFFYGPVSAADNYVFRIQGDNYTVHALTMRTEGTSFSVVVDGIDANDLELTHNRVIADTTATNFNFARTALRFNGNRVGDNVHIAHNHIVGGSIGLVTFPSSSQNVTNGTLIEHNTLERYGNFGIAAIYENGAIIRNNTLRTQSTILTVGVTMEVSEGNGLIENNDVHFVNDGYGLQMTDVNAGVGNHMRIINNFVTGGDGTSSPEGRGINISGTSNNVDVVNNSVHIINGVAASRGIYAADGNIFQYHIVNNNIAMDGPGVPLYVEDGSGALLIDYNNLYQSDSSDVAEFGNTIYSTLTDLQNAGLGLNSVFVDPGFNLNDLHTCEPGLNMVGLSLTFITADIDGDSRNSMPDIGADEFFLAPDISLGADINKCPGTSVTLDPGFYNGATYFWSTFDTTASISVTTPDEYVVQVVGNCASSEDTIQVMDIPAPVASFTETTSFLTVIFTNTSQGGNSYLWDFGDGNTSTQMNPTHVYAAEGQYTVQLTVTDSCGSTSTFDMTVKPDDPSTGIASVDGLQITAFPNPSTDWVTLELNSDQLQELHMSLKDLSGRELWTKTTGQVQGKVSQQIPMGQLATGTYVLEVRLGENTASMKLMKH